MQRRERLSSLAAHHAEHHLEWSEPIHAPDESVVIDGKIGCVFDGTRFVTPYERAVSNTRIFEVRRSSRQS